MIQVATCQLDFSTYKGNKAREENEWCYERTILLFIHKIILAIEKKNNQIQEVNNC